MMEDTAQVLSSVEPLGPGRRLPCCLPRTVLGISEMVLISHRMVLRWTQQQRMLPGVRFEKLWKLRLSPENQSEFIIRMWA